MIQFLNNNGNGIDTSDATAENNDLISDKTAYAKNEKITGNIELNNYSSEDAGNVISITDDNIICKNDTTKKISIYNRTPERLAYEKNSYVGTGCSYEDLANYIELTPEKLVQGNNILGVDGTATSGLDVSLIRQCDNMFSQNTDIIEAPMFDTSKIKSMSYMFGNCRNLQSIPNYNMSNVTNTSGMFLGCSNLVEDKNVNPIFLYHNCNARSMFENCIKFNGIYMYLDGNIINTSRMFYNCRSLTRILEIRSTTIRDMSYMYFGCINLTDYIPEYFETDNVMNMESTFENCTNLICVPNINATNVINMHAMFKNCSNLQYMPFTFYEEYPIEDVGSMFEGCTKLETIDQEFPLNNVTNMMNMFLGCPSLTVESLNYILYACSTAIKVASENKTLKYIGLSEEQATICETLDYYQTFLDAGWATGY